MIDTAQLVQDKVEELRYHTNSRVRTLQKSKIPTFGDIKLYGRKYYIFDGNKYPTRNIYTQSYLAVNLPYSVTLSKNDNYIDSMINMIIHNKIQPFMLFIQGRFIKWSDITIVKDYSYSYIIIHNMINYKDYDNTETVILPCYIKYGETIKEISKLGIGFDSNGLLSATNINTYIDILDKNIHGETIILNNNKYYFNIPTDQYISKYNFIIFKNNIPYKKGIDKIIERGANIFEYSDIEELKTSVIYIKVYYYINGNLDNTILRRLDNESIKNDIITQITTGVSPSYLESAKVTFDFTHSRDKKYSENLLSSIDYIMKYNSDLFNDTYLKISNIESILYKGKDILDMCDDKGFFHLFRKSKDYRYDTFVMMFKNNKLFENFNTIKYNINMLEIFIDGKISDDDNIELLFFSKVCNLELPIIITKDKPILLSEPYNIEDLMIYSDKIESTEFDIYNEYHSIQYKVPFTYEKIDDKVKIIFNDEWFYGKELSIIPSRQFRYCYNNISKDRLSITLSPDFKFCHDIENYMIFINGQKLDPDQYRLTNMIKDVPFDDLSIYTDIIMKPGDKIEAFYIPDKIRSIVVRGTIPDTGTIEVDMDKLSYNFSKNLHFIFVNGMKIYPDSMVDVGRNKIRIKNDIGSINNLCIIEHIDSISILTDIFIKSSDLWTNFINSLTEDEYNKLIKGTTITNTFSDMKEMQTTSKAVIYEIINNYYRVDGIVNNNKSNNEFLYTYNSDMINENDYDDNGNYIIRVADANIEDKAAIYHTTEDEKDDGPSYNYNEGSDINNV